MRILFNIAFCVMVVAVVGYSQTHPRLFYGPSDVSTLQSRSTTPGTPAYELWQLIKTRQADCYKDSTRWSELNDGFVMENALAVALAYTITGNSEYLYKARAIIFGNAFGWTGLVNNTSTDEFFRITRIGTLATIADVIWNSLTVNERIQIGQQINSDVITYLRPKIFASWRHIDNNHLAREGSALAFAAITFYDLYNASGNPVYPQASGDIDRVRQLIVTNLNGKKNIIERLYDTEGGQSEGFEYAQVGLTRILPLLEVYKRFDGVDYVNSTEIQKRLSKFTNWLSYEIVPAPRSIDYFSNNINDSDVGSGDFTDNGNGLLTTTLGLGGYYQTATVPWVFQNSVQTIPNLQTSTNIYWQRYSKTQAHLISLLKYNQQTLVSPSTVLPKSKFFPERGLVYVRSSNTWADNTDIQFALEDAPCINPANNTFSVKHDQADKNHFTLQAFGDRFIRDYGRGAAFGGKRPETHNYIMIDNRGEAIGTYFDQYGIEEDDWLPHPGKIVSHIFNGTYTFIHGDAKDAFSTLYSRDENGNPVTITQGDSYFNGKPNAYVNPVLNADRYVMFNQAEGTVPAYIAITDDINKDNAAHNYEWLFHSDYSASGTNPLTITGGHGALKIWQTLYSSGGGGQTVQSLPSAVTSQSFSMTAGSGGPLDDFGIGGNVITSYKNSVTSTSVVNPYFHTILYPYKSGAQQPTVSTQTASNGSCFKISWSGYDDYSLFRHNTGTTSSSNFVTDGKLTQVRKTASGQVTSFSMGEGTNLTDNGTVLVQMYGTNATVMYSGTKVTINGTNISDFSVYAPNATAVEINGISVAYVKNGNYVESNVIAHSRTWSGTVTVSSNVTVNSGATLTIASNTTVLNVPNITVQSGATLVVSSGAALKFNSATNVYDEGSPKGSLVVYGKIHADGATLMRNLSGSKNKMVSTFKVETISFSFGATTQAEFITQREVCKKEFPP